MKEGPQGPEGGKGMRRWPSSPRQGGTNALLELYSKTQKESHKQEKLNSA